MPSSAGLFLDFDGVLADIAAAPEAARLRPGLGDVLVALATRLARVVVISGRPVAYLDAMVPAAVDLVGLYGLETRIDGDCRTLPEAEQWRGAITALTEEAEAQFGGQVVEPKGVSLTLHYRTDPELATPLRDWVEAAAVRTGVQARPAKQSFELHPPIRRDKGTALRERAEGLEAVAYVGDDLGDLPAFDAIDELAAAGLATRKIAVDSTEVPPIVRRRADAVVEGPAGVESMLRDLLTELG